MHSGPGVARHYGACKHNRKLGKITFIVAAVFLLSVIVSFTSFRGENGVKIAYADDEDKLDEIEKDINEEIDRELDLLISEELDEYFKNSASRVDGFGGSLKSFIKSVIDGENSISANDLLDYA